jgi:hypothetical protein
VTDLILLEAGELGGTLVIRWPALSTMTLAYFTATWGDRPQL